MIFCRSLFGSGFLLPESLDSAWEILYCMERL